MNVNLIVLVNGMILISQVDQVSAVEIGDPDLKLTEPFVLNQSDETLHPWLIDWTSQNQYKISSDKIVTMAEPKQTLIEKYQNLIK